MAINLDNIRYQCDYLVIGGGAAGCIVAKRLAEAANAGVILLEAGRVDEGDPAATDLSRLDQQDESYDWGFHATPVSSSTQPIAYARAKMLGGCANHNDCAFLQPPASDFDHWPSGWQAGDNAAAFARIASQLHIESRPVGNPLSRAFIDANIEQGLTERNYRQSAEAGTGWFPLNAQGALRQSSSVGYLHPLASLPDQLQVICDTHVTRLIIERGRVTGVETDRGTFYANREVILCAGSIGSPHLLMLSGIGDAKELLNLGIEVQQHLPAVGKNLIDHVAANIAYELKSEPPAWALTPCEATALIRVDADAPAADVLFHFVLRLREKYLGEQRFSALPFGVKISPNVARPKSRGQIRWSSPDPYRNPDIELDYLSDADGYDQRILIAGLRYARQLGQTSALAPWLKAEVFPGPDVTSDDEFLHYIGQTCETVFHPCGTCKMGAFDEPDTVVTTDLKVKGIGNLRVADASVFADMVSVNICNTVMMVAERAAELILQEQQ